MRRTEIALLALALGVCLASCTPAEKNRPVVAETKAVAPAPAAAAMPLANAATADGTAAGIEAPTATEASQVVVDYYAAINARDYRKAYGLWDDDGTASGQSYEHFSGGYANTETVQATVGEPIDEEGAAGSRYITVPVELVAKQFNGTVRSYHGRFALRAVVADGASERQRRWHLASAEMQKVP